MSSEHSSTFGHLSVMNVHSALFAFPDDISDVYNVAPPHLRLLVLKQYIYIIIYIYTYIYIISTIIYHDRA